MLSCVPLSLPLLLAFPAQAERVHKTTPTDRPAKMLEEFFRAESIPDFRTSANKLRLTLSPDEQKRLLPLLVDKLGSDEPLRCESTMQNCYYVINASGRSCWLISRLIHADVRDPAAVPKDQREAAFRTTCKAILEYTLAEDPLRSLSLAERLKRARDKSTSLTILQRLVVDPDPHVRLAARHHPNLPSECIELLMYDPDPRVRGSIAPPDRSAIPFLFKER